MIKKPTPAQAIALRNLVAGHDIAKHLSVSFEYGGFVSTVKALNRNGWLDDGGGITADGRASLDLLRTAKMTINGRSGAQMANFACSGCSKKSYLGVYAIGQLAMSNELTHTCEACGTQHIVSPGPRVRPRIQPTTQEKAPC